MNWFEITRACHIVFVIAWMAGLLMYPRLLVYRLEAEGNPKFEAAMDKAASSLRKIILLPSMVLVWVAGGLMIWQNWQGYVGQPWFWVKIAAVTLITWIHHVFLPWGRKIARGEKPVTVKQLRMINEVPFLLAIVAVVMVVVQPFAG